MKSNTTSTNIELNFFQRLMWYWSQHIAYNAIHIVQLKKTLDINEWKTRTLKVLHQIGLGHPSVRDDGHVQWLPLETLTISRPQTSLSDTITHELNRPFKSDECPLRFFIVENDTHYDVGITYNHWIADAYAIRKLLQCITEEPPTPISLTLNAPRFQSLFKAHLGLLPRTLWLRKSLSAMRLFYRAYRPPLGNPLNFHSQYVVETIPSELLQQIKHHAKQKKVTVNDLFCAIIAQLMGDWSAPLRYRKKRRRNRVAIGNIVDIRHAANVSLAHTFSQYLSSYAVVLDAPETKPINTLIEQVATYTTKIKQATTLVRHHYHFETALRYFGNHPRRKMLFFYKHAPLAAGISNVNIDEPWEGALNYWRVSPTGPLAPLVFSLTTFDNTLTVCLAYRTSAMDEKIAKTLCGQFCEQLQALLQSCRSIKTGP